MGLEDSTEVKGAPNTWLAFASKYGLAGVVIFMMSGFIWVMFNFITNAMTVKLASIENEIKIQVQLERDHMALDKEIGKESSVKMDALIKAVERLRR